MSCACPSIAAPTNPYGCVPASFCPPENFGLSFPSLVGPPGPPGSNFLIVENIAALRAIDPTSFAQNTFITVLGYYAAGDNGGGFFAYDAASVSADNGGTIIEPTTGPGAWLREFDGSIIDIEWFGLIADDNTKAATNRTAIKAALSLISSLGGATLVFPAGNFYVNCTSTGGFIAVPSNTTIKMSRKTRLIAFNSDNQTYALFRLFDVSDITIEGGELVGEPTAAYGPVGDGLLIQGTTSNVTVIETRLTASIQDGLYLGGTGTNLRFLGIESYSNIRSGCSIISGSNITFDGCRFLANGGAAPQCGVNVENQTGSNITDILFTNCRFEENIGIALYVHKGSGAGVQERISAIACSFTSNTGSEVCNFERTTGGAIQGCTFASNSGDNIRTDFCSTLTVDGNTMTGGNRGIYITRSRIISVTNNIITGVGDDAIGSIDDSSTFQLNNCDISDNIINSCLVGYGIDWRGSYSSISNNHINRVGLDGIVFGGSNNHVQNNTVFEASLVTDNTYRAVIEAGQYNTVTDNLTRKCGMSQSGTAQAGGAASITLTATAPAVTGIFVGYNITILSGTGAGQTKNITAYVGGTLVATVDSAWATPPDNTSVYEIIPAGNQQKYGVFITGVKCFAHDNDAELGGKTDGYLDSGSGTDSSGNRG